MPSFGRTSLINRATLHPKLQQVLDSAIKDVDFVIDCGIRGQVAQDAAFAAHLSEKKWPNGNHNGRKEDNYTISRAADIVPYPVDWKEGERPHLRFAFMMGCVYAHAKRLGIRVRFGMDWNQNFIVDEKFIDLPHVELHPDE